jgi:hypothetical protein
VVHGSMGFHKSIELMFGIAFDLLQHLLGGEDVALMHSQQHLFAIGKQQSVANVKEQRRYLHVFASVSATKSHATPDRTPSSLTNP